MLENSFVALVLTFAIALAWLRLMDFVAHKGWMSSRLSRKIIHIGTGPIFVLCWMLFPGKPIDRWLAALVPLAITFQFALVGLGFMKDQASVDAMSRTGDRREILRGPLFYGIVFVILTVLYWIDSPIGMIALMMLCGGDGLADIIGKRFGNTGKLPWSKRKSWAGLITVFIGGWLLAVVIVGVYFLLGKFSGAFANVIIPITIIALASSLVESLPYADIDNLTLPFVAVVVGHLLL